MTQTIGDASGVEHPGGIREISLDWLNTVLEKAGLLQGARVAKFQSQPFGPGAGQLSAITRVRINYDRDCDLPESLVLKFHAPNEEAHELSMRYRVYEREVRFFTEVSASVPLPVPTCYAAAIDRDEEHFILFLEDLGDMEFCDQIVGADEEHARRVVKGLAKLHASTWNQERIHKMEWMPYLDSSVYASLPSDFKDNWSEYLEKFGPTNPEGAEALGDALGPRIPELVEKQARLTRELGVACVCHGDTRLDNVAFETANPEITLFDWQLVSKNMGPSDVSYFMGGSVPTELRREKEQELLRLYHKTLCAGGVDNLSFDKCWDLYRLGHLLFLCYMVTGGCETDVENARSFKLFQTASQRHFATALDLESLSLLEQLP